MYHLAVCDDVEQDLADAVAVAASLLKERGVAYELQRFRTPAALSAARERGAAWDLILLDIMMDGQDGIELAEALREKGVETVAMDLARCDMAEAVAQAFRFSKLVLATPTYNADVFPFMKEFIHHLTERNYQNRTVAFIENGSWAPMAAKVMTKMLEGSKNLTYAATTVTVRGALNAASEAQLAALADELSR